MSKKIHREHFTVGEKVIAAFIDPLPGNTVAPPLEMEKEYPVEEITLDSENNQHLHVGLVSKVGYVTSYETGEVLPDSAEGGKHWCHPSRFKKADFIKKTPA